MSTCFNRVATILILASFSLCGLAAEVSIDPDRMLVVNGARTFVIGLYEYPRDDAGLDEVAKAGFNVVRSGRDKVSLDRLSAHGLFASTGTGGEIKSGEDSAASEAALRAMVEEAGSHPALVAWEVPDETLWSTWLSVNNNFVTVEEKYTHLRDDAAAEGAAIARGYEILKRLDPHHPIWMNHAAGNSIELLAHYAHGADIVACDMYPVMPYPTEPVDISRSMLASVGLCTSRMQASAPGKPVWMVLQGTGWGDFDNPVFTLQPRPSQQPTLDECRFMAYDTIVRGARGVLYWGTHIPPKDGPLWRDILTTARELADNAPLLTAPDADTQPTVETRYFGLLPWPEKRANIAVRVLGKDVDGGIHWIVVNECPFPVGYTLDGLSLLEGREYMDATNSFKVNGGQLSGTLPRYGVQILRPKP